MDQPTFTYQPRCSFSEGDQPATHKVAVPWSYGTIRELKTYALCREEHLEQAMERARSEAGKLTLAEGEAVGPVAVYPLPSGTN